VILLLFVDLGLYLRDTLFVVGTRVFGLTGHLLGVK